MTRLLRSEVALLLVRRRVATLVVLVVAVTWTALVLVAGERGRSVEVPGCVPPACGPRVDRVPAIDTGRMLGRDRDVAGALLPIAALAWSIAAASGGATTRRSADEGFVVAPGAVRGPAAVAVVRGAAAALCLAVGIGVLVVGVAVARSMGTFPRGGRSTRVEDVVHLSQGLGRVAAVVVAAWMLGWFARVRPMAGAVWWVVVGVIVPSVLGALPDVDQAGVVGATAELFLRGGPLTCWIAGDWPSMSWQRGSVTVLAWGVVVSSVVVVVWWDRRLRPVPSVVAD